MKPSCPRASSLSRIHLSVLLFLLAAISVGLSTAAVAQTTGMVCDDATDSAVVFDADAGHVLGVVPLGANVSVGDCAVTRDGTLGLVAGGPDGIWIVDLVSSPTLASGPNPVGLSAPAESIALDPTQGRLVVCGGDTIAVLDLAARKETVTLALPDGCTGLDVCVDGSVLVASGKTGVVRRFVLDDSGGLATTGDELSTGDGDVSCAAGGLAGVVVDRETQVVRTFKIPGLSVVEERPLVGTSAGFVDRRSNWVYTVSRDPASGTGSIEGYTLDPTTALLDERPAASIPVPTVGAAPFAVHPNGTRLYAAGPGRLTVYDSLGGPPLGSIEDPAIVSPVGVCLPQTPEGEGDTDGDGIPDDMDNCPTVFNPTEVLFEFESGAPGWTHTSLGGTDSWRVRATTCLGDSFGSRVLGSNGNYGLFCNQDSSQEHSQLLSPVIDQPSWPDLWLSFRSLSYDEAGTCTTSADADAKDAGITTNGGTSYELLNDCTPLGDEVGTPFDFQYDISQYSGQAIQAVFVYDTSDAFFGHTFAIDDVRFFTTSPLDFDGDGAGDACDSCTDTDGDGFGDPDFSENTCLLDNCPTTPNAGQDDGDDDLVGDLCDNCPAQFNSGQLDADGDGDGDLCDADADGDGLPNPADNCPTTANASQLDSELDGIGDVCDNCPAASNPSQTDVDADGEGDACDACIDVDGDGYGEPGDACLLDNCPNLATTDQSNADGALFGATLSIESATSSGRTFAVDIDDDGDKDVFTGGGRVLCFRCFNGSPPAWHENLDGLGTFGPRQELSVITATPTFPADVNGDGAIDLFSVSGSFMYWYENDGGGDFTRRLISNVIGLHGIARAIVAVDLDGDQDVDVVAAGYDDEAPFSDKLYWFENLDGAGAFGPIQFISESAGGPRSVSAADFDGDGDMDVLTGGFVDGVVGWYENVDGAGDFNSSTGARFAIDVGTAIEWVAAVDIDSDGDQDVVTADSGSDTVTLYRRSGAGWTSSLISSALNRPIFVEAADIDQDGDPDLMAVAFNGDDVVWWENTDGFGTFGAERQVAAINGPTSVFAADLNEDGGIDLVTGAVTAPGLNFPFGTTDWIANIGGDPAGDACDCDDADPTVFNGADELNDGKDNQCPGDVGFGVIDETSGTSGFLDAGNRERYSWPAQSGATLYEAARSATPDFAAPCLLFPSSSDTFVVDPATPPSGGVFHYLNRPLAPNTGSWGQLSSGAERIVACTP